MLDNRRSARLAALALGAASLALVACASPARDAFVGRWAQDPEEIWQELRAGLGDDASGLEVAIARAYFEQAAPPGEGLHLRFERDGTYAVWGVIEAGNETEPGYLRWRLEGGDAVVLDEEGSVHARGRVEDDRLIMVYEPDGPAAELRFVRWAE